MKRHIHHSFILYDFFGARSKIEKIAPQLFLLIRIRGMIITPSLWLVILFWIDIGISQCILEMLSPSVGPIGSSFSVSLSAFRGGDSPVLSSISLVFGNISLSLASLTVVPADMDDIQESFMLPIAYSPSIVSVTSPNCSGVLLFQYFDFNDFMFELDSPSSLKSGATVSLKYVKRSWLLNTNKMVLKLSSLDVGNSMSSIYPVFQSNASVNRISIITDGLLASLGSSCGLSISFDGNIFFPLNISLEILFSNPLRIGIIFNGPILDYGWNYAINRGVTATSSSLLSLIQVSSFENSNVYDVALMNSIASSENYDLIFLSQEVPDSEGYSLAASHPNVKFLTTSTKAMSSNITLTPNFNYVWGTLYEARYLAGIATGLVMSPGGYACYIKAYDNPEVNRGINAFTLGIRKYNPTARVLSYTINTWGDRYLEQEVAGWYLADGRCEVLCPHSNHIEPLKVFVSKKKLVVGCDSDSRATLGEYVLTSAVFDWNLMLRKVIQSEFDNTYGNMTYSCRMRDGCVLLSPLSSFASNNVKQIVLMEQNNINLHQGSSYVFCGPMVDNSGSIRIQPGICDDNEALLSMDWVVAGVDDLGSFAAIPPLHDGSTISFEIKLAAYLVLGFFYIVGFVLGYWMYTNQSHPIIVFAQSNFLYLVILGCLVGVSAIIPLSLSPHITDLEAYNLGSSLSSLQFPFMDRSCQAIPWCLVTGFCFTFPVLYIKTYRQHLFFVVSDPSARALMLKSSKSRVFSVIFIYYFICCVPLIVWFFDNPLSWKVAFIEYDEFGHAVKSTG